MDLNAAIKKNQLFEGTKVVFFWGDFGDWPIKPLSDTFSPLTLLFTGKFKL